MVKKRKKKDQTVNDTLRDLKALTMQEEVEAPKLPTREELIARAIEPAPIRQMPPRPKKFNFTIG